jgi:hypothetical protein
MKQVGSVPSQIIAAAVAILTLTVPARAAYEWRAFPDDNTQIALWQDGKQIGCYHYNGDGTGYFRAYLGGDSWGSKDDPPVDPPKAGKVSQAKPTLPATTPVQTGIVPAAASLTSALAECNARRASHGLTPFVEDPALTAAAQAAADFRAANLITGHTGNDFQFLPPGVHAEAAGCAAWEPGWGWGSCCSDDNYRFAGAGMAVGRDGKRYMHLFVR